MIYSLSRYVTFTFIYVDLRSSVRYVYLSFLFSFVAVVFISYKRLFEIIE